MPSICWKKEVLSIHLLPPGVYLALGAGPAARRRPARVLAIPGAAPGSPPPLAALSLPGAQKASETLAIPAEAPGSRAQRREPIGRGLCPQLEMHPAHPA